MKVIRKKDDNPEFNMLPKRAQAKVRAEAEKLGIPIYDFIERMKLSSASVIDEFFEEFFEEMGIKNRYKNPRSRRPPKNPQK